MATEQASCGLRESGTASRRILKGRCCGLHIRIVNPDQLLVRKHDPLVQMLRFEFVPHALVDFQVLQDFLPAHLATRVLRLPAPQRLTCVKCQSSYGSVNQRGLWEPACQAFAQGWHGVDCRQDAPEVSGSVAGGLSTSMLVTSRMDRGRPVLVSRRSSPTTRTRLRQSLDSLAASSPLT